MEQTTQKKRNKLTNAVTGDLFGFLLAELLFFVALGLDQSAIIVTVIGIILLILAVITTMRLYTLDDKVSKILFGGGLLLFIFGALAAFGSYYGDRDFLGLFSVIASFITFFLLGYLVTVLERPTIRLVIMGLFLGLGVLILLTLLVNLYNYGLFYLARYKGKIFYYDGQPVVISNQVRFLIGLEFVYANEAVAGFYNGLLASVLLPTLLTFNEFEKKLTKWILIGLGALGLLALFMYPNWYAILFYGISTLALLVIKFYPLHKKWLKPTLYVILALFGIFGVLAIFWAFDVFDIFKHLPVFSRIFSSGYMLRWKDVIQGMTLFGYNWHGVYLQDATGNFLLDVIYQFGAFAFIILVAFIAYSIWHACNYYQNSDDPLSIKLIIISYLITLLVLALFIYPYHQRVETDNTIRAINHHPITNSGPFLIGLVLVGYMVGGTSTPTKRKSKTSEQKEEFIEMEETTYEEK